IRRPPRSRCTGSACGPRRGCAIATAWRSSARCRRTRRNREGRARGAAPGARLVAAPLPDRRLRARLPLLDLRVVQIVALALRVDPADAAADLVLRELLPRGLAVALLLLRLGGLLVLFLLRFFLFLLPLAEFLLLLDRGHRAGLRRAGRRCRGRVPADGRRLRTGRAGVLRVHGTAALDAFVDLRV